jgi:F-type H+-transporting ATPase subunit epsilon
MYLEIITPEKKLFAGEIKLIKVPGTKGSFEILKNHAPIISTLEKGIVKIISPEGSETFINIGGGVIEAKENKIILLAETVQV